MEQNDNKSTALCLAFKLYKPPARIQNTWPTVFPVYSIHTNLKTRPNIGLIRSTIMVLCELICCKLVSSFELELVGLSLNISKATSKTSQRNSRHSHISGNTTYCQTIQCYTVYLIPQNIVILKHRSVFRRSVRPRSDRLQPCIETLHSFTGTTPQTLCHRKTNTRLSGNLGQLMLDRTATSCSKPLCWPNQTHKGSHSW